MKKTNALNAIIQNLSGCDDGEVVQSLCDAVEENGYCNGITCADCPFNSASDLDALAIEIDKSGEEE